MKISLISKEKLGVVSRRILNYPLHIAEKDYFLTLALNIISQSHLKDRLVFKGGTALYHHYLQQYRFSEDLDFTSIDQSIIEKDIVEVFKKVEFFQIKKIYTSPVTVKIEKLQYSGILDQPNFIKIDISNVENLALKPKRLKYKNAWGIDFKALVMDKREICAEKISATNNRIRYRDFYDLYLIVNDLKVDFNEAVNLLHQKDVERTISKTSILENWKGATKDKDKDVSNIFLGKKVSNKDITKFLTSVKFKAVKKSIKI